MTGLTIVLAGQAISILASGMTGFSLAIWVFQRTSSATSLGIMQSAFVLPYLLVIPLAGVMVDRYNRAIIPQLLKYGGHPVFYGPVQGRFIHPDGADNWDAVGIVRYRSCRDMLKMAAELAGTGADIHKWASIEKTQVFPVKPLLHLASIRGIVAVCFIIIAVALI
jgi:hypothetical protein